MTRKEADRIALSKSCQGKKMSEMTVVGLGYVRALLDDIFDNHEAQLKAKDEYIKTLECRAYHAEGYINDLHNNPRVKRFYDKKARSIVAMLFKHWKHYSRIRCRMYSDDTIQTSKTLFKQAYKMLKEQK